jgi:hypothetical protein
MAKRLLSVAAFMCLLLAGSSLTLTGAMERRDLSKYETAGPFKVDYVGS